MKKCKHTHFADNRSRRICSVHFQLVVLSTSRNIWLIFHGVESRPPCVHDILQQYQSAIQPRTSPLKFGQHLRNFGNRVTEVPSSAGSGDLAGAGPGPERVHHHGVPDGCWWWPGWLTNSANSVTFLEMPWKFLENKLSLGNYLGSPAFLQNSVKNSMTYDRYFVFSEYV